MHRAASRRPNQRSILPVLFHSLVPAYFYGGSTASDTLLKVERSLRECAGPNEAAVILEKAKADFYRQLSGRFEPVEAMALTIKVLNLLRARRHLHSGNTVLQSRPLGIIVDPSNTCRLACPGCVHSARSESLKLFDWPDGTLPENLFSSLLKSYGPQALGVYFCNYGEPLLNLSTPKMIRAAKQYLMWTGLSTSLSVQRFDPDAYIKSGLDFMVLAIDGATQSIYERYRRNGNLETVLENARRLVEAKRRLQSKTPVISWNYLAFEHNAHEIRAAMRKARALGLDQFRVSRPFDVSWDDARLHPYAGAKERVYRLHWLSMAHLPGNWNPFPNDLDQERIREVFAEPVGPASMGEGPLDAAPTCHWLYKNLVVDATGRVLPCCGAPRPDADLVFAQFDGNGDPFNSEKYRQARIFFSQKRLFTDKSLYCARCEWDHISVNIGGPEIRRYFRAADAAFFDRRSLRFLSEW